MAIPARAVHKPVPTSETDPTALLAAYDEVGTTIEMMGWWTRTGSYWARRDVDDALWTALLLWRPVPVPLVRMMFNEHVHARLAALHRRYKAKLAFATGPDRKQLEDYENRLTEFLLVAAGGPLRRAGTHCQSGHL